MSAHSTSPVQTTLRRTQIDAVLDNQRQRWTQGERPFAETYLAQYPWLCDDSEATLDLIDHEVVLRSEAGERPTLDEYVKRFPRLKESLAIQFSLHENLLSAERTPPECLPTVETLRVASSLDTAQTALPSVPRRVGPYLLLKPIGSGGMGAVYLADDTALKRQVALKVLLPNIAADSHARARFLREAQAAATIDHENVISVYQVGEADETPFIAMPLLHGETLQDRLQREHTIPWREALRIGRDVCRGLAAAHRRGLLHRDIKPSNLWLDRERRRVVILDFGLAHVADSDQNLTSAGTVLGTPSYMSPEQVTANPLGPQTDLFSLGIVLYQAVTGCVPFEGKHILATLSALANQQPAPPHVLNPEVPPELSVCVMSLLAKEPSQRPRSAEELLDKFDALAEARATASPSEVSQTSRRTRRLLWGGFAVLGVLLAGIVIKITTKDGTVTKIKVTGTVKGEITDHPASRTMSANVADRAAAEWVVSQAGRVHVRELGRAELIEVRPGGNPPQTAFQLIRVEFVGKGRVTDDDLARFKNLTTLEDLRLEGTNVRGRGLKLLGDMKSLRHLSLPSTPFGDDDVEHLAAVPELTELWLGETAITDVGLAELGRLLPNLVYLRLERTKITGAGLKHLQTLKRLKSLVLSGTSLKDEDVVPLAQMPALVWLDLRATPVTDRALDELIPLRSLRGLSVFQSGMTAEGVLRFSRQRPECNVYWDENRGPF